MKKHLFILLVPIVLFSGCGVTTVDGEHSGYITAVEKNGLIWKTGRAYIKTELESSQEDAYCVESDDVLEKLREASKNKDRVTLIFKDELMVAPWRCSQREIGIVTDVN